MSKSIRRKYNIGIGKEAVRGTAVAPSYWLKPTSDNFDDKIENKISERAVGVIEDSEDMVVIKDYSGGEVGGEIFDESFGLLLLAGLGAVSSVESADVGVYDHTFSVLQSAQHPALTVEVKRNDIEQKAYANCVVDSLKIMAGVNDYAMYEVGLRGKKGASATSTPAYVDENYFLAKNVSVKLADDIAGLSGASVIDVKSVELSINKNVEDDDVLGSNQPNDFLVKQFAIEGKMEINFEDTTIRDYALNGLKKAMRIALENTDETIGASSNPGLQIDLAKIKIEESPLTGDLNDIVGVDITFKGFYSASEAKSIVAVLTNEVTSY